jgi:hypothetical protein
MLEVSNKGLDAEIDVLQKDKETVVATLLMEKAIRSTLDLKSLKTDFLSMSQASGIRFKGFTIKNDVLSTTAIANDGTEFHPDPVSAIIALMKTNVKNQKYRLEPIRSIMGDSENRTTGFEFKVTKLR